nr:RNA-directed DNA polymerase, eukaryota [Tanacetum cinerariifolium]
MAGDKRSFLSKEDLSGKISKTVFVTNFPDHLTARDLWNVCTAYGKVVDVYIPLKRSKSAYGKVVDVYIPLKRSKSVMKSNDHKGSPLSDSSPSIVIDDSCIVDKDLSCSLMGKIKDINALSNIYACSVASKEKMLNHEGLASWFSELCSADPSFNNLSIMETNKISLLRKKFQALKARIKNWSRDEMHTASAVRHSAQSRILELDKLIDKGLSNNNIINERISLLKDIHDLDKRHSSDLAQKAKIQWAIEGDKNSKYFHGIINKKRSQPVIRGVLVDGEWIEDPPKAYSVASKEKMLNHEGLASWFSELCSADPSFVSEDRLVWISIEGLPFNTWNNNAYAKKICVVTKVHTIINQRIKIIVKGKIYWIRVKELKAWAPEFNNEFCENSSSDEESMKDGEINSQKVDDFDHVSESCCMKECDEQEAPKTGTSDPSFPHGFTPKDVNEITDEEANVSVNKSNSNHQYNKKTGSNGKCVSNRSFKLKAGGSILDVMEDLIEIGHAMGYNMEGCLGHSSKKDWIRELNLTHKVDFTTIQETKSEKIDRFAIKSLWGNFNYDFAYSPSVGLSGGILCIWNPNVFSKESVTVSDSFVAVRGTWISSSLKLMFVSVYAPKDISERRSLWDYINHMINLWDGECIILEDFNEVRSKNERFGSNFNEIGAKAFNHFISSSCLIDLPLEGYSFTWALKSASKMSKLDRFLILEGLISIFLRLLLYVLIGDGFDNLIADTWNNLSIMETNKISFLRKKFQALKERIKNWSRDEMHKASARHSFDLAQKAKIQWAIEGDENSKYFHGIINKKRSQLASRGVLVDGEWIEDPPKISIDQNADLESDVSLEEIKKAVWECGTNKSLGPDGFSFDFIRKYWKIIQHDVVNAVK